jgi:hypothetical protein
VSRLIDWAWVYTGRDAAERHARLTAAIDGISLAPLGKRDARRLREMIQKLAQWAPREAA